MLWGKTSTHTCTPMHTHTHEHVEVSTIVGPGEEELWACMETKVQGSKTTWDRLVITHMQTALCVHVCVCMYGGNVGQLKREGVSFTPPHPACYIHCVGRDWYSAAALIPLKQLLRCCCRGNLAWRRQEVIQAGDYDIFITGNPHRSTQSRAQGCWQCFIIVWYLWALIKRSSCDLSLPFSCLDGQINRPTHLLYAQSLFLYVSLSHPLFLSHRHI